MGVCTIVTGFMVDPTQGILLRALTGLGGGMIYAPSMRLLTMWFSREERGRATGTFFSGMNMASLATMVTIPPLCVALGWRFGFWFPGGLAVVGAVMAWFFMREPPAFPGSEAQVGRKITRQDVKSVLTNRDLWPLFVAGFFLLAHAIGTLTWGLSYLVRVQHFPSTLAGLIMGVYALGELIGAPTGGYLSDLTKKRKYVVVLAFLACTPFLIVLAYAPQISVPVAVVLFFVGGLVGNMAVPINAVVTETAGLRFAGSAMGLANSIWQLGGAIAPAVFGYLIDMTGGYTAGWITMAIFALLAAFSMALVNERPKST